MLHNAITATFNLQNDNRNANESGKGSKIALVGI